MQHRSEYDNNMNTAWQYNTQPWPGARTQQDVQLQQKFCGRCPTSCGAPVQVENYEPLYGFRTPYDMELQRKWSGTTCRDPTPVRPIPIPVRPIPIPVRPIPIPVRPIPIPVRPIPIPVGPIPPNSVGGVMAMPVGSMPVGFMPVGSMPPVYNYACNSDHSSGGANSYASY